MPAWNRNEPIAAKRRVTLFVDDIDGAPALATTLFTGTNELLVDKGDGDFVAAAGALSNTKRPLVIADDVLEAVDTVNDRLTFTAHGLLTGDGPIQFTTTGALPTGIAAATDYWVIKFDANQISIAASLANALAGLKVDITAAGSGVNTLVDTASTKRLNDGSWIYEASQVEIDYRGIYFAIRISKPGVVRDMIHNVDLDEERQMHAGLAAAGGASTITLDFAASATNDLYKDAIVVVVGGVGVRQANTIASYVGATKVATMARPWAIVPDATSQFVIIPAPSGANPTSVAASVWAAIGEGVHTYGDLMRGLIGAEVGPTTGYNAGSIVAKSLSGAKTRWTWTVNETGRLTVVPGDLT